MRRCIALVLFGLCLAGSVTAAEDVNRFSAGVTGGTLGLGAEVGYAFSPRVRIRGLAAGLDASHDIEPDGQSDLRYDADVELRNAAALVDFHPFTGNFRLTAGVIASDNSGDGSATCRQTLCNFGDGTDVLFQGDRVDVDVEFADDVHPYLGLGWSSTPESTGRWRLSIDLGVTYLGDPDVDASLSGPSSGIFLAEQEVENEERNIEDDLEDFEFYPVVMIGAAYRF
ncbi:outer membrane protein domain-containing protein [Salinisphaera sp. PC39]|uniref:hypothetical protein n=1 Tax=Salinisphaera sp. PC39 TaxID=1304156 RepID=UPI003342CDB8